MYYTTVDISMLSADSRQLLVVDVGISVVYKLTTVSTVCVGMSPVAWIIGWNPIGGQFVYSGTSGRGHCAGIRQVLQIEHAA
jgi:hypothetical protein